MKISEILLLKAVTNPQYRTLVSQLEQQPLPHSVPSFDNSFMELVTEQLSTSGLGISACRSTCNFGPITFVCDGTTK